MYRNHSKRGSDKIPTKMLRASKKIYSFFVLDEEIIKKTGNCKILWLYDQIGRSCTSEAMALPYLVINGT